MGKLRFTLTNIIFWVALTISCLLTENISLLSKNYKDGFGLTTVFIVSFAIIGLLVFYYILEHKKNNLKIDKVLLPIFIIFGILMIWNILRQGDKTFLGYDNDYVSVSFTKEEKIRASLGVITWLIVLYAAVFVSNRFKNATRAYRLLPILHLLFILLIAFIDLFIETEDYLVPGFFGVFSEGTEFLFGNSNIWALFLLSGLLTAVILQNKKFNIFYFVAMLVLYFFMLKTSSLTGIVISTIVVGVFPICEFVTLLKTRKRVGIICLSAYFLLVIFAFIIAVLFLNNKISAFTKLYDLAHASFSRQELSTFTGRTGIFKIIIYLLKGNPLDFTFGFGLSLGDEVLKRVSYHFYYLELHSAHNGVMQIILRFGLLGGIFYIGLLLLILACFVVHLKKKHFRFVFIYGLAFVAILMHSFTEATTFFTSNYHGMYFGIVFALPVLNVLQEKHYQKLDEELINTEAKNPPIQSKTIIMSAIWIILSIVIAKTIMMITNIELFETLVILITSLLVGFVIINKLSNNCIDDKLLYLYRLKETKEKENEK